VVDSRQMTLDELLAQAEERERLQAQEVSNTRAAQCPKCGSWSYDERRQKVCGLCGGRFTA